MLSEKAHSSEKTELTRSAAVTADRLPLTDAELSELWHQAKQQPFRFARLIEKAHGVRSRR